MCDGQMWQANTEHGNKENHQKEYDLLMCNSFHLNSPESSDLPTVIVGAAKSGTKGVRIVIASPAIACDDDDEPN